MYQVIWHVKCPQTGSRNHIAAAYGGGYNTGQQLLSLTYKSICHHCFAIDQVTDPGPSDCLNSRMHYLVITIADNSKFADIGGRRRLSDTKIKFIQRFSFSKK